MATENRDWVQETYESFVKTAKDREPTDPVEAIAAYFEKNATDELKARCKAEGKTAKTCWRFIMAVARKVSGTSCHIDPAVVYAMAMHYFQDVPADWDKKPDPPPAKKPAPKPAETPSEIRREKARAKAKAAREKAKKPPKAKKPKFSQGFFFEILDDGKEAADAE